MTPTTGLQAAGGFFFCTGTGGVEAGDEIRSRSLKNTATRGALNAARVLFILDMSTIDVPEQDSGSPFGSKVGGNS